MTTPRAIVPHAGPPLDVQRHVLASVNVEPEYVDVSGDDHDYWRLIRRLWSAGDPFMLLEHDVLPWPGALHLAWRCPEPWCVYPYLIGGAYSTVGHGCVKYGAAVMEAAPDAVATVGRRHWSTLDSHTIHAVRTAGFRPHVHQPPVLHLNPRHFGTAERVRVNRGGRLVDVDPVEWQLGWVPESIRAGHHVFDDDAAARAAASTVAGYPID